MEHVLAFDIGGTKIAGALVSRDGSIHARHIAPTPLADIPRGILHTLGQMCAHLRESAGQHTLIGIGIGTAGQVDTTRGTITYAVDTLPGWAPTPLAGALREIAGLPVVVENDVNALALGEAHFGAGRGFSSGLYAAVGTGIGGAVIVDGRLWHGAHWSAGEIGHIVVDWRGDRVCNCGQSGHLEAYAAGPAIVREYCRMTGADPKIDLRQIARLAADGDDAARRVIAEGAEILGLALGGLLNTLDPEILVIGGGLAELGAPWWEPFERALRACPMPAPQQVILKRAELGVDAALVGAAWLAFETFSGL